MKKFLAIFFAAFVILSVTACSSEEKNSAEVPPPPDKNKILVAYFSATGNTKNLAETAAEILGADIYEIKPEFPYTAEDLEHKDETKRATVEQRNEKARPALADKNAPIDKYGTIVLAFPIWWGIEPRIMDTFVETYDLSGRTIIPICTSGSSEIGSSGENLKALASPTAEWKTGKSFQKNFSKDEVKKFFNDLGL